MQELSGSRVTDAAAASSATPVAVPPVSVPVAASVAVSVPVVETADEVAALVLAVPGVTELHSGRFGEAATYLPGRRVAGVQLRTDRVEVHVVVAFDAAIRSVAQQIHAVVAAVVDVPVQVFIEDLAAPHAA
ncbi:hypothetical protein OG218_01715 [Kineococcus sp. NBC_00420]|uniref:hypothetical protein n=1 Tax=Kineococcus sp. NBC_00420 TaxID=2903564 RepID=UPI002E211233